MIPVIFGQFRVLAAILYDVVDFVHEGVSLRGTGWLYPVFLGSKPARIRGLTIPTCVATTWFRLLRRIVTGNPTNAK